VADFPDAPPVDVAAAAAAVAAAAAAFLCAFSAFKAALCALDRPVVFMDAAAASSVRRSAAAASDSWLARARVTALLTGIHFTLSVLSSKATGTKAPVAMRVRPAMSTTGPSLEWGMGMGTRV
jgi:hypothetical protein